MSYVLRLQLVGKVYKENRGQPCRTKKKKHKGAKTHLFRKTQKCKSFCANFGSGETAK